MSRRRLSDDERTLWKGVTRSISPLRRRPAADEDQQTPGQPAAPAPTKMKGKPAASIKPPPSAAKPAVSPALVPLGRRLRKQVARGVHTIDGRLDLHGLTQAEAHHALLGFLRNAQARGGRIVLVITGKGSAERGGDPYGERGVLKRQVPLWLRMPEFRGHIVGFESAGLSHGGEGALYVRLRRARSNS